MNVSASVSGIQRLPTVTQSSSRPCNRNRVLVIAAQRNGGKQAVEAPSTGLGLKAIWYSAEKFGDVLGLLKGSSSDQSSSISKATSSGQMDRSEAVASIREDYEQNYFVSGLGNMLAYEDDCLFADPFAGFRGVDRFKKNVSNLGGLMEDIQLDLLDWQQTEDAIRTKWRFSAILQLPWRPRLAAGGGTIHTFSQETGRIIEHREEWDVEPGKVVRQLLKPASRLPSNRWEELFGALDKGDFGGAWSAAAGPLALSCAPVVVVSLAVKAATGEGLQGALLGAIEGLSFLAVAAGGITEGVRLAQKQKS